MTRRVQDERRGVTLIEMMVALVVFGVVMAGALRYLSAQGKAVQLGNDRMGALANLQFSISTLDDQLRTAGGGVLDKQPFLVYAGADVIAFNADFATNVANDPFASYYDPDAPSGTVRALPVARRIAIPGTSFSYPSVNYTDQTGINGPAETIIFYFTPDTSTSRTDDFLLERQVNDDPPEMVARNILATPGADFFQYERIVAPVGEAVRIDSVPGGSLPLKHSVAVHLAPSDTGPAALIDSIRAVRVTLTVTDGNTGTAERRHTLSRLIAMPNAGLATRSTCGDPPLLATTLDAAEETEPDGSAVVRLSWGAATDETAGEQDVVRYVIWRKAATDLTWGDPYLSIPAGNSSYTYVDAAVPAGTSLVYALAAQDCTPALSSLVVSAPVALP